MNASRILSIVIPFGGSPLFRFTLESLSLQSIDWRSIELMICTDTAELAERLAHPYRSVFSPRIVAIPRQTEGHPAPRMRNLGAREARGDRLVFLDSDSQLISDA